MISQSFFTKSIRSVFCLDLRALAILRISLGLVLLADLIYRSKDIKAFYSAKGVLPIPTLFEHLWHPSFFSIYTSVDSEYLIQLLFAINFFCVFCLIFGYRTRLFTVFVWLFLISLHNRNPLITQAGDNLMRMIVFWGIFLPWGYLYSIDSYRNIRAKINYNYESFAGIAFVCQIAFLYYFSALLKNSPEWHTDFTAIYYALSLDQLVTPIGEWLYPYPELLKMMTASVYYVELLLPFLLFIPLYNHWFRGMIIVSIIMLHVGIYATMNVGLFSATSIVSMFGLLPTPLLNALESRYARFFGSLRNYFNHLVLKYPLLKTKGKFQPPLPHPMAELFAGIFLFMVLGYNLHSVGHKILPENSLWVGELLKLNQHWGMFAPAVYKNDGWYIYEGKMPDGKKIDILRKGKDLTYERPKRVTHVVKSDRWRKYGENILMIEKSHFRPYLCNYLLNDWNENNTNKPLIHLSIIYMHEKTLPDYQTAPIEKWILCSCPTNSIDE
jgi:hypothetical protein